MDGVYMYICEWDLVDYESVNAIIELLMTYISIIFFAKVI